MQCSLMGYHEIILGKQKAKEVEIQGLREPEGREKQMVQEAEGLGLAWDGWWHWQEV